MSEQGKQALGIAGVTGVVDGVVVGMVASSVAVGVATAGVASVVAFCALAVLQVAGQKGGVGRCR